MGMEKKINKILLLMLFAVLVGFADCHFEVRQFEYKMSSCPSADVLLSDQFQNEEYDAHKINSQKYEKSFSCPNLNLYEIDSKFFVKIKMHKLENYIVMWVLKKWILLVA